MSATHVGFAAAARQVEVKRDPELPEGLQVLPEPLPRKLPQCVLVPLSCFLHLSFLWGGGKGEDFRDDSTKPPSYSRAAHD